MTTAPLKDNIAYSAGSVIILGSGMYDSWSPGRGGAEFAAGEHGLLLAPIYKGKPFSTEIEFLLGDRACKVPLYELRNCKALVMHVCDALKAKNFCFSGDAPLQRDAYIKMVELQGGGYETSITKKCHYLVANDAFNGSKPTTKIIAAKAKGISIVTTDAFLTMAKAEILRVS